MDGEQKTAPKGASGGHNGGVPLTFRSCSLQMILWDWDLKHWYKPQYQVSTALTWACTCTCGRPTFLLGGAAAFSFIFFFLSSVPGFALVHRSGSVKAKGIMKLSHCCPLQVHSGRFGPVRSGPVRCGSRGSLHPPPQF